MAIHGCFRVQCDGPCKMWLTEPSVDLNIKSTAIEFPSLEAAEIAALAAGMFSLDGYAHIPLKQINKFYCSTCFEEEAARQGICIPERCFGGDNCC